jgi:hypothetical protein
MGFGLFVRMQRYLYSKGKNNTSIIKEDPKMRKDIINSFYELFYLILGKLMPILGYLAFNNKNGYLPCFTPYICRAPKENYN